MKGSAKIEYANVQCSCFAWISWPVRPATGNVKILAIQTGGGEKHFLSVSGAGSKAWSRSGETLKNVIKINGKFGNALNLKDGEEVVFWEVDDAPTTVTTAKFSCCSADDWEILETNSEFVAENLLTQLRVVYPGLKFPFWLSKSMIINLHADEITPGAEYGILVQNTDVIVPSISTTSQYILPEKLRKQHKLRIHPIEISPGITLVPSETILFSNVLNAFTHKSQFKLTDTDIQDRFYAKISGQETEGSKAESVVLRVFFIESIESKLAKHLFPVVNIPCFYVHPELLKEKKFCSKSWVWLNAVPESQFSQLNLRATMPLSVTSGKDTDTEIFCGFKTTFDECVESTKALLSLTGDTSRPCLCGPEYGCLLIHGALGSGKTSFVHKIAQFLSNAPYYVCSEVVSCAKLRGKKSENIEKELMKVLTSLESKQPSLLILDDIDVLIPSPKAEEQSQQEDFLFFKTSETLLETLMKFKSHRLAVICTALSMDTLNEYWKSRPGFHFFHKYIKIKSPTKSERLEIFTTYLNRYLHNSGSKPLSCINLTTPSPKDEASPNLKSSQNDNKTKSTSHTPAVQKSSNVGAIRYKSQDSTRDHDGLGNDELTKQIAAALGAVHEQNATPQFIVNVAKKWGAYLNSIEQNVAGSVHVPTSGAFGINNIRTNEDVNEQMNTFNEILQEEIRFSGDLNELRIKHGAKQMISWDAIGGLTDVKEELKKILEWPIKFPQFFKNAPVRLPCGILFYGYPGTGKTLLGLGIQSIVNVKFIHVKGPELLSKYIGASEQAVQDVFARARDSRPCILFFDEFDSLVPRRGHDSSGVTDRVVNQFLSEMDGIDGGLGEGVYLIAATSRPDLIDPAVLRPGRLDKHLFFDLPSERERKDILKAISSQVNIKLKDESEWNEICKQTEGFTGADLNSLMFSAQLAVVQEYLSKMNNNSDKLEGRSSSLVAGAAAPTPNSQEIKVTTENLVLALKDFKPSVQGQELRKFQAIYQGFSLSKSGGAKELSAVGTKLDEEPDNTWRMEPGKRATLA